MSKWRKMMCLLLFVAVRANLAQAPQSSGKATELVVVRYEKLIASGALLTPQGWEKAGKLFAQSTAYPQNGTIFLTSTGGSVGEMWLKGDKAEVQTKWTDDFGSIDPVLQYKPSQAPELTMTMYSFDLIFTNKHRDIGAHGETINEVTGAWEWKMKDTQTNRWATLDRAIHYVIGMRDTSTSPVMKKNAAKTLRILNRLKGRCPC